MQQVKSLGFVDFVKSILPTTSGRSSDRPVLSDFTATNVEVIDNVPATAVDFPDQTDLASCEFELRCPAIPGVLAVRNYGEASRRSPRSLLVVVPTLDSPTSRGVLELKYEVLDRYPEANIDVRLKGLQERGLNDPSAVV